MSNPVLSIITVCFQSRDAVQATMDNVLLQTWRQFEYLVIDGGSADGTMELLEQASTRFAKEQIPYHTLSEPDQGIYDAMNKGAEDFGENLSKSTRCTDFLRRCFVHLSGQPEAL